MIDFIKMVCIALIVWVIMIASFWGLYSLYYNAFYASKKVVIIENPYKEYLKSNKDIKRAMRYHGIQFAEYDCDKHEWFFIRKGDRCNLFAYLEKEN